MTTTQLAILRVTAVPLLVLGVLVSIPGQHAVAGMNSTEAWGTSTLGGASSHPMSNGKIAFLGGFADGSLGVINPDGSGLRRLTRCTAHGCGICGAVWSPDGRRIAFVADRATNRKIDHYPLINMSVYVMNANGSGERRVTSWGQGYISCWGESLAWSPDGTRIAVTRAGSLYVLDLKTGGMRRLTAPVSGGVLNPVWSPDGSKISFALFHGCGSVCPTLPYIMNADGRGLRRLSAFYGDALSFGGPQWSPDGRTIAFCASSRRNRWGIYAVNPDGSHLRLLAPAPPVGANQLQKVAGWSPDGKHILYFRFPWNSSKGPQVTALWVMNANGTGRRVLYSAGHVSIGEATWSPDGRLIAFSVLATFRSGLFVMGADGRHLRRLMAAGYDLAWQPVP